MDEVGAGLGCAVMDLHARDIVVARDETVYICGVEGRGACFAYEGQFITRILPRVDSRSHFCLFMQATNRLFIHT